MLPLRTRYCNSWNRLWRQRERYMALLFFVFIFFSWRFHSAIHADINFLIIRGIWDLWILPSGGDLSNLLPLIKAWCTHHNNSPVILKNRPYNADQESRAFYCSLVGLTSHFIDTSNASAIHLACTNLGYIPVMFFGRSSQVTKALSTSFQRERFFALF